MEEQWSDEKTSKHLAWLKERSPKLLNVFVGVIISLIFVFGLLINLLQLLNYLIVKPISIQWYRRVNFILQYAILVQIVVLYEWWSESQLTMFYSDDDSENCYKNEHLIGIFNHTFELDPFVSFTINYHHDSLGSAKAFLKKPTKYLPVFGWMLFFGESIFLDRNWKSDSTKIGPAVDKLMDHPMNVMLMLAPEGTRFTQQKHRASVEFAESRGLKKYKYHLLPRVKGFVAAIKHLKMNYPNCGVYHVQIILVGQNDSITALLKGQAVDSHAYVKRIPMEAIPTETDEEIGEFLYNLFDEKDQLVDHHKKHGRFPGREVVKSRKPVPLICFIASQLVTLTLLIHFFWIIFSSGSVMLISVALTVVLLTFVSIHWLLEAFGKRSSYGIKTDELR